jgi:DNA-binding XRE family transcriptional regulator
MARKLSQNPHAGRDAKDRVLQVAIGRMLKGFRAAQKMTVTELAAETGLSAGMLSKIENGLTSPSLGSLQALSNALGVPLTAFFRSFEERRAAMHVKAGMGAEADRAGTRAGHQYNLLGHLGGTTSGVTMEPYLITLTQDSDTFETFQHAGVEFLYMLEGVVQYRHEDQTYLLEKGDSLFFEADAPHGPEVLIELPTRFLSIICYTQEN